MVSGARSTFVLTVMSLRRIIVCLLSTQCVLEEEGTSSGSAFSDIGASPHFIAMRLRAGSALMLLRDPRQEIGCAPAGCLLLCLLAGALSTCVLGVGCHVGASVRVTVCCELV